MLAKRHNNTKRTYLLVNPLQAKHIPVSPTESLKMMTCLGEQVADNYPGAKLVIGFAETATAIAAAVAGCLGADCKYIHTTREPCAGSADWLYFNEEHSHAVEQKLYSENLAQWIADTPQIIFVDDEISTGKTLINVIAQLCREFPEARNKQIVAASIINRLSPENEARFADAGIESRFLVKLGGEDFADAVAHYEIAPAPPAEGDVHFANGKLLQTSEPLKNVRLGVNIAEYRTHCQAEASRLADSLSRDLRKIRKLLVLGTEECMYPALILGQELEKRGAAASVKCHATTRSPIGICPEESYPIRSGFRLHSFYDNARETFIYNLSRYDAAVVVTDTIEDDLQARSDLEKALRLNGCDNIIFVEGGRRV